MLFITFHDVFVHLHRRLHMTKRIHVGGRRHWRRRPGLHSIHAQHEDDGRPRLPWPSCGPWRRLGARSPAWPVPDAAAAQLPSGTFATASPLPLVADIHFDYRLAIAAAEAGAAKIRINPGNIGGERSGPCRRRLHAEMHENPHPHRRQRRQPGAPSAGKIRPRHGGGFGRERVFPSGAAGEIRVL